MPDNANCCWALYIRLSHEDGDKAESLSVSNQKLKLTEYIKKLVITQFKSFISMMVLVEPLLTDPVSKNFYTI